MFLPSSSRPTWSSRRVPIDRLTRSEALLMMNYELFKPLEAPTMGDGSLWLINRDDFVVKPQLIDEETVVLGSGDVHSRVKEVAGLNWIPTVRLLVKEDWPNGDWKKMIGSKFAKVWHLEIPKHSSLLLNISVTIWHSAFDVGHVYWWALMFWYVLWQLE